MTTYLLYTTTGQEDATAADLRADGIYVRDLRQLAFESRGKKRPPAVIDRPYLPNYLFAALSPEQFNTAKDHKHVYPSMRILSKRDEADLDVFASNVAVEWAQADRIRRAGDIAAMHQHKPGQALRITSGPFAETLVTFRAMVETAKHLHPMIQADADMMGGKARILINPADVEKV